jgi:hypothetical protein
MGYAAASTSTKILAALRGLIRALDHRVPQVERVGEQELADAVMTDDGGPPPQRGGTGSSL